MKTISTGILYPLDDGWAVATRGSFASDQALHASALLASRYGSFAPPAGLTVLFEIIYPGNRIVVDYRDLDDVVLLGAVDIATGVSDGPEAVAAWPGPVVERFAYATLAETLAATTTDARVKIKYEKYVHLHRIVTGLSTRTVWEHLSQHRELDALLEQLPQEFHDWVRSVATSLLAEISRLADAVEAAYHSIVDNYRKASRVRTSRFGRRHIRSAGPCSCDWTESPMWTYSGHGSGPSRPRVCVPARTRQTEPPCGQRR